MKKNMPSCVAKLVGIGGLVTIGLIFSAPIGAPIVICGKYTNLVVWGIIAGASVAIMCIKEDD